jgi:hypothetical protein
MNKTVSNEVLEVISEASDAPDADLLSRVEAQTESRGAGVARAVQSAVVIGKYRGRNAEGEPLVESVADPTGAAVAARAAISLAAGDVGRDVVLVFEDGDATRPIVLGVVQPVQRERTRAVTMEATEVRVDGERVTIEAEKEVVIRCGEASITLTRAGKVLIRGKYVLSRSSGSNRIKGASIDIN